MRRAYCKTCGVRVRRVDMIFEWEHPPGTCSRAGNLLDDPLVTVIDLRDRLGRALTFWFFYTVLGLAMMVAIGAAMWVTLPIWIAFTIVFVVVDRILHWRRQRPRPLPKATLR